MVPHLPLPLLSGTDTKLLDTPTYLLPEHQNSPGMVPHLPLPLLPGTDTESWSLDTSAYLLITFLSSRDFFLYSQVQILRH